MDPHQGTTSRAGRTHHVGHPGTAGSTHMLAPQAMPTHAQQGVMYKTQNQAAVLWSASAPTMMQQPQSHVSTTGGTTRMVPSEYRHSWSRAQAIQQQQQQQQLAQGLPQSTAQQAHVASRHGGRPPSSASTSYRGSRPHPKKSRSRLNVGEAASSGAVLGLAVEEEQAYKRAYSKAVNAAPLPPTLDPSLHRRGVAAIRLLTSQSGKCPITRDSAIFLFQQALSLPRVQRADPFVTAMAAFMLACKTREQEIHVESCDNMIFALGASEITKADITSMELHLLLSFDWRIHPFVPSELIYPMLVKTLGIAEFTLLHARHPTVDTVAMLLQIADACVTYYFTTLNLQQSFASMRSIAILAMVCARACLGLGEQGWCPTLRKWAIEEESAGRGPYPSFDFNVDRITRAFVEHNPGICEATKPGLSTDDSGIMSEPPTPGHNQSQSYLQPQYQHYEHMQGGYEVAHGMPSERPRPRVLREESPDRDDQQQHHHQQQQQRTGQHPARASAARAQGRVDDSHHCHEEEAEPEDLEVASCFRSHISRQQRNKEHAQEQTMHQLEPLPPLPSMEGVQETAPLSAQQEDQQRAAHSLAGPTTATDENNNNSSDLNDENAENVPLRTVPGRSHRRVRHRAVRRGQPREPLQVLDLTSSTDDDDDDDDDSENGESHEGASRRENNENDARVGVTTTTTSALAGRVSVGRPVRTHRLSLLQDMTETGADLPGDDDFYDLAPSTVNPSRRGRGGPSVPNTFHPHPDNAPVSGMQLWSPGNSLAREVRGLSTQSPCNPPKTPKMSHHDRHVSYKRAESEEQVGGQPWLLPTTHNTDITTSMMAYSSSSAAFASFPSSFSAAATASRDNGVGEEAGGQAGGRRRRSSNNRRHRHRRRHRGASRPTPKEAP